MIYLRSIAFNVLFYVNFVVMAFLLSPSILGPRPWAVWVAKLWTSSAIWQLRVIAGIRLEVRGLENVPEGPSIVASKHQSAFETIALVPILRNPVFILKRELNWVPIFGWYSLKMRMIPVNRGGGMSALKAIAALAKVAAAHDRQIVIFPEGTRKAVGAPPDYKFGVAKVYEAVGVPCVPVAINTGLFWPRRGFLRYPGTAVIEFLPPIPPGLDSRTFLATLTESIETASDRLAKGAVGGKPSGGTEAS